MKIANPKLLPTLILFLIGSGCAHDDMAQHEFDEDSADTICKTADTTFSSGGQSTNWDLRELPTDAELEHSGSLTITLAQGAGGYSVSTADINIRPGVNRSFEILIESPALDFFTTLQFVVEYRDALDEGSAWKRFDLEPDLDEAGWWFHRLTVFPFTSYVEWERVGAVAANCELAFLESGDFLPNRALRGVDYVYRVRAYPKSSGLLDLEGTYGYTLSLRSIP